MFLVFPALGHVELLTLNYRKGLWAGQICLGVLSCGIFMETALQNEKCNIFSKLADLIPAYLADIIPDVYLRPKAASILDN